MVRTPAMEKQRARSLELANARADAREIRAGRRALMTEIADRIGEVNTAWREDVSRLKQEYRNSAAFYRGQLSRGEIGKADFHDIVRALQVQLRHNITSTTASHDIDVQTSAKVTGLF